MAKMSYAEEAVVPSSSTLMGANQHVIRESEGMGNEDKHCTMLVA